jgi:quinol monooxygenase YgiN
VPDESDPRPGPVRLTGRLICASPAEADIVKRHLPEHIRLTRAEPGCLAFDVQPTTNPLIWQVEEAFRDARAFEAHQHRARASAWGRATASITRDFAISGLD